MTKLPAPLALTALLAACSGSPPTLSDVPIPTDFRFETHRLVVVAPVAGLAEAAAEPGGRIEVYTPGDVRVLSAPTERLAAGLSLAIPVGTPRLTIDVVRGIRVRTFLAELGAEGGLQVTEVDPL